jgi:ABC-type transporter MlaC component
MPSDRSKRLAKLEKKQTKVFLEQHRNLAKRLLEEQNMTTASLAAEFLSMTEAQQTEWVKGYEEYLKNEGDESGST